MFDSIRTFVDHNAAIVMAVVWSCIALFWFYGCEAHTQSILHPDSMVTRSGLEAEIVSLNALVASREKDLEHQELLRQQIAESLSVLSQGGGVNPTGVISLVASVLGIGAISTYRKKDTVIKVLKNNANQTDSPSTAPST